MHLPIECEKTQSVRPLYPAARMKLYLVRHADAVPGAPDELRPLSDEGRDQARALAEQLKEESIDVVLTSPLLRARETGEALARATGSPTETDPRLAPGATAEAVRAALEGRGERIAVVGHQPDCGRVAAALTGGTEPPFPPAGMIVIDLP
jgi:phosphohistidine phosphatase